MRITATYNPTELPGSPALDVFADPVEGVLTDEHAACSYGLPVFVGPDGLPMGPGDLGGAALLADTFRTSEKMAGSREIDPEAIELVRRAMTAGFRVNACMGALPPLTAADLPSGNDY